MCGPEWLLHPSSEIARSHKPVCTCVSALTSGSSDRVRQADVQPNAATTAPLSLLSSPLHVHRVASCGAAADDPFDETTIM